MSLSKISSRNLSLKPCWQSLHEAAKVDKRLSMVSHSSLLLLHSSTLCFLFHKGIKQPPQNKGPVPLLK